MPPVLTLSRNSTAAPRQEAPTNSVPRLPVSIGVTNTTAKTLTPHHLNTFIATLPTEFAHVGVSAAYGSFRRLEWLSFCRWSNISGEPPSALVIRVNITLSYTGDSAVRFRNLLDEFLRTLTKGGRALIAYDADILASALYLECGVRVRRLYNVQSLDVLDDEPLDGRAFTTRILKLEERNMTFSNFNAFFDDRSKAKGRGDALLGRAWAALAISLLRAEHVKAAQYIDTLVLPEDVLKLAVSVLRNLDQLDSLKPMSQKHDFEAVKVNKAGDYEIIGSRFKTRARRHGPHQVSRIESDGNSLAATTRKVKGKTTTFKVNGGTRATSSPASSSRSPSVQSVVTIGKESPTSIEAQVRSTVCRVLCGDEALLSTNAVIRKLWALSTPPGAGRAPMSIYDPAYVPTAVTGQLNAAQRRALQVFCTADGGPATVSAVVPPPSSRLPGVTPVASVAPHIQLVQGPPGTGKTTLIASIIQWLHDPESSQIDNEDGLYIIAQSNVAVKRVAEKLVDIKFLDFKLLVSDDFYEEWHEHLYEKLLDRLITSAELPDNLLGVERKLGGVKVILSTLSMLSNPRLVNCGLVSKVLRPSSIIVDEASQIPVGDYLPILTKFGKTLRRMCFVGDHKQLAPYGQSDVPDLKSVFDVPHLRREAHFLNIQYRMPHPVGRFVSKHVYDSKLETKHKIDSKFCLRFVDIEGSEEKEGLSTKNTAEAKNCVRIARYLASQGKSYRILTAYDAQRQLIEDSLKAGSIQWEDKVFNVDSFQGNEEDYIVVSVVRTVSPGFLNDKRRTNVMLSRCKKGMVILGNKDFLLEHPKASATLVGVMTAELGGSWLTESDILNNRKIFS